MGLFDKFRKHGKNKATEQEESPVQKTEEKGLNKENAFKERVKATSNMNLTSEQLRERLLDSLAIDDGFKKMPMVKEKILSELNSIELKTVEDIKKSKDEIWVSEEGDYILFQNGHTLEFLTDEEGRLFFVTQTEKRQERDIGAMLNSRIKYDTFETKTGYIYDIRTGIEVARSISDSKNGELVSQCDIYRDDKKIEMTTKKYTYIHPDGTEGKVTTEEIDLTERPYDIATLDGTVAPQIEQLRYQQMIEQKRALESGVFSSRTSSNYEVFHNKLLAEKIRESKNSKGCYVYMASSQSTAVAPTR